MFCWPLGAQQVIIPAAGNCWEITKAQNAPGVISTKGITGWKEDAEIIKAWFRAERTGRIDLAMRAKNAGTSEIEVTFRQKSKKIRLNSVDFDTVDIGSYFVDKPGYQCIELKGISKTGETFADVTDFFVRSDTTTGKIVFVKDDFYFGRRGSSVHLRYDIPSTAGDVEWFYNEITVPEGNDVIGSYFMANGFADGYFGIQVNSETERRILFSVWSPYKTDNPQNIPDEFKIQLLKKGPDVITKEFGNEGSGGQSYRKFFWKAGNTYRFLLRGTPAGNNSTDYTAWFYAPEIGNWELIASFRRPKTNHYLRNLYSFLENFIPETGYISRKANYSNQWACNTKGQWFELTGAKFTADATARKNARLDYAGGLESGIFYLRNCGFFDDTTPVNQVFVRPSTGVAPQISFECLK